MYRNIFEITSCLLFAQFSVFSYSCLFKEILLLKLDRFLTKICTKLQTYRFLFWGFWIVVIFCQNIESSFVIIASFWFFGLPTETILLVVFKKVFLFQVFESLVKIYTNIFSITNFLSLRNLTSFHTVSFQKYFIIEASPIPNYDIY